MRVSSTDSPLGRIEGMARSFDSRWVSVWLRRYRANQLPSSSVRSSLVRRHSRPIQHSEIPGPRSTLKASICTFVGQRDFDPVYDELHFDLGFPKGSRPFAITLRKDLDNPFIPRPKPPESQEVTALKKAEAEEGPPAPPRIEIELDGIADRVLAFPGPRGTRRSRPGHQRQDPCTRPTRSRAPTGARGPTRPRPPGGLSSHTIWERRSRSALSTGSPTSGSGGMARFAVPGKSPPARPAAGERPPKKKTTSLDARAAGSSSSRISVDSAGGRVAADGFPGGVAPAERAVLDGRSFGHRLGCSQSPLPAADRARDDPF